MRSLAVVAATSLALLAVGARAEDMDPARAAQIQAGASADAESARQAGLPLPESTRAQAAAAAAATDRRRSDRWGLSLDVGVPQGASIGVMFRPVPAVRLWAGPAWNYVGWGVHAGVAAVPWRLIVTPVLSAEIGRYFDTDVSFLANDSEGVPEELKPLLRKMGYSYAAAHVGVEIGSQRSFSLFVRAGLSYLSLSARGTATATEEDSGVVVTLTDPKVRGTIPSAKVGVQLWF